MKDFATKFDDKLARWSDSAYNWGTATSNVLFAVLTHVDLRSFINYDIERRRTQQELDTFSQLGLEQPPLGTQSRIEAETFIAGEYWNVTGTGFVNSQDWENPQVGNLIPGPEDPATFSTLVNATLATSALQFVSGPTSIRMRATAGGDMSATSASGLSGRPVYGGNTYSFAISIRAATTGRSVNANIIWYDAAGSVITTAFGPGGSDNNGAFTTITNTAQAPDTARFAALQIYVVGASASEDHYVDAISFQCQSTGQPVVGLMNITSPTLNNVRGMKLTATGGAINLDLVSSIPYDPAIPGTEGANISTMTHLVIRIPSNSGIAKSGFTAANSYVQLSSREDGAFTSAGNSAGESARVLLTADAGSTYYLSMPIANFAASGFDLTKVRGIKIHLEGSAVAAGTSFISTHGIRAIQTTPNNYFSWDRILEIETRRGVVQTNQGESTSAVTNFLTNAVLIRGSETDTNNEDYKFVDGVVGAHFYTGGALSPQSANVLTLAARDRTTATDVGSNIRGEIRWSSTGTVEYRVFRADTSSGAMTVAPAAFATWKTWTGLTLELGQDERLAMNPPRGIDAEQARYYFQMQLVGNQVELRIYRSSAKNVVGQLLGSQIVTSPYFLAFRGRAGWMASFTNADAFVDQLDQGIGGYGTLRTKQFQSDTPVDGAQLVASYSQDLNLFKHAIWLDPNEIFVDSTKTTSGNGSIRTTSGIMTNRFVMEDWRASYVEFDIWVPSTVSRANQPYVVFDAQTPDEAAANIAFRINLTALQPAQWNRVEIDLEQYANQFGNLVYHMEIKPPSLDGGLGTFWIDKLKIGRRLVEWQVRASSSGEWRNLRRSVNDRHSALHFPPVERGRFIQLQAVALTPDAWVAGYKLLPHYAELGLPLFDQSFQTF